MGRPLSFVGGLDEVGRGCLAGPVVAAAFVVRRCENFSELLDRYPEFQTLNDSKLLSEKTRERLAEILWHRVAAGEMIASVHWATSREIDHLNILWASMEAMARAALDAERSAGCPIHWLVDGNRAPRVLEDRATTVIKGDRLSLVIAAASILAKVYRDRWMQHLELRDPRFSYGVHKGYPTPRHQQELNVSAPTAEHRTSFAPVRLAWEHHQKIALQLDAQPKTSS